VKNNNKLILFDLDGVLFNTKSNMEESWEKVRVNFNIKKKFKDYFSKIGIPFEEILKKLKINKNIKEIKNFYKNQSLKHKNLIKIYPGVKSTLLKLIENGNKIGIVTSKDYERTKKLVNDYNLKFSVIQCPSKKLRGKPFPDTLIYAINILGFLRKNTFYVGDTRNDYLAAKKCSVKFIYAKYGYGKKTFKAFATINKFKEILKLNFN
jgi:phosphoglycolate phosphatase